MYEEIKALKELLDMGAITQEEFDSKKKELLNATLDKGNSTDLKPSTELSHSKDAAPKSRSSASQSKSDTSATVGGIGCLAMLCFPIAVIFGMFDAYDIALFFMVPTLIGAALFAISLIGSTAETLSTPEGRREFKENSDREKYNDFKYTCPMCGSHKIKTIGAGKKAVGVLTIGLASKNIGKNYQCADCQYKW